MPKRRASRTKAKATPVDSTRVSVAEARAYAQDYFTNQLARLGYGSNSLPEATQYDLVRLSNNYWLLVTLYRNSWLPRRVVDLPAIDMTRAWPKLVCDVSPEDIQKFDRTVQRTFTPQKIRQAIKWARLYGGAGALIAIKGHEKILEEPLDLEDVMPGSYLGLIPFDRWVGIYPTTGEISEDYDHPIDWGLPQYYECRAPDRGTDFRVHSSRVLRFTGPEVPTPEFQAQMYWGISVIEIIYEELRKRDSASWAILNLLFRANLVAQTNPQLAEILSGLGSGQDAAARFSRTMQAQNELLSNQSMLILGKDGKLDSVQYSFAGMDGVYSQFQMDVAGAAEIPVTRLFGRTITGLGQTNDADERLYEESIASKQNEEVRPQLDKLYPVIAMSEWGDVPDDLDMVFPSIRVLSEVERGDLVDKISAPIIAAYNSGLVSQKTAMKELRQLGDTTNVFSNITDEDIDNANEEPELPGELDAEESAVSKPNPMRQEKKLAGGAVDSAALDARKLAKKLKWRGLDISIENAAGSIRAGEDDWGQPWKVTLTHDYGYIRGTVGADKDPIDVFYLDGPNVETLPVYVVHTLRAPLFVKDDEDKVFIGFENSDAARRAFVNNYDKPEHFGSIESFTPEEFIEKISKKRVRRITHEKKT